jgi:hypothetical protein
MAYRAYQPDRGRRRRRLLLIAVTIILVVAAIAFVVSRQTEERGTADFFAAADEASALHAEASALLTDTLAEIGPLLSRQEVTRRLSDVVATAKEADALLDLEVPSVTGAAYGSLASASAAWVSGTEEVERVITGIMDGVIVNAAEVQLQGSIDQLRVGDVGYELFRDEVARLPEDVAPPPFDVVAYSAPVPDDPGLYDALALTLRIQGAYNLAPRHDVTVIGSIDPPPVGERGGIPLVPFSDSVTVSAIVSNLGNEDESAVSVVLDVLNVDTGEESSFPQQAEALVAGASTTVAFTDLGIAPGGLYQVTLSVRIPDDVDTSNDTWTMTFIWNGES